MTAPKISRAVCIAACLCTIAVMIWAMGPFGQHAGSGEMVTSLFILPLLAVWAIGPYAIANKFAHEVEDGPAWFLVLLQAVIGVVTLGLYVDGFVVTPEPGVNAALIFTILPIYQFIAVLAGYYGLRLVERLRRED